jgi:hypothetical protein
VSKKQEMKERAQERQRKAYWKSGPKTERHLNQLRASSAAGEKVRRDQQQTTALGPFALRSKTFAQIRYSDLERLDGWHDILLSRADCRTQVQTGRV